MNLVFSKEKERKKIDLHVYFIAVDNIFGIGIFLFSKLKNHLKYILKEMIDHKINNI